MFLGIEPAFWASVSMRHQETKETKRTGRQRFVSADAVEKMAVQYGDLRERDLLTEQA